MGNPANRGAGNPDGRLFVANQFEGKSGPPLGQLSVREAVEMKPTDRSAKAVAERALR